MKTGVKIFRFWVIFFCLGAFLYAGNKPVLSIYTYDAFAASWGPAPKIKKIFDKLYNCNLTFIPVDSSIGALRKIQLEGEHTKADILLGLDTSSMQMAKKTGLFMPLKVDTSALILPKKWQDDTFYPFDWGYFAFVYDSKKLKNPPNSFKELANMDKNIQIVIEDPRSSTPGLGLLLWVKSIYKEKAKEYWQKLSPHILTITKGWSEAYDIFLKGEADMVLSYTTSPAYHIIAEKKTNYKYAHFKEGHYMQIEVAAILKSSPHKKLAKKFISFMLSSKFADIIPLTNWMYPVVKSSKPLPKPFLDKPKKALLIDSKTVYKNKKEYIQEWLNAVKK